MRGQNAFFAASAAAALLNGVGASTTSRVSREPPQPACTSSFQPFAYAGCFKDTGDPRALLYDSELPTQSMTIETCISFCKGIDRFHIIPGVLLLICVGNDYKYAGVENYGECFCGTSIHGDKLPESDCATPCTGDESVICCGIDRISVYQDPTFPVVNNSFIDDFQYLGCFSEGTSGQALAWRQDQLDASGLTTQECLFACKTGGYDYGGVGYGSECYCGVALGKGSVPVDPSSCNMGCLGAPTQACGGFGTLDLYMAEDMGSSEPCQNSLLPTTTAKISSTSTQHSKSTPTSYHTTAMTTTLHQITTRTANITSTRCSKRDVAGPTPTCEYECADWCSSPLPPFQNEDACLTAVSSCLIQEASCFLHAGYPGSIDCFNYSKWCHSISSYCDNKCPGKFCSLEDCKSQLPPFKGPPPLHTVRISRNPLTLPADSKPTPIIASVPVPTCSNLCIQPDNPSRGYTTSSPVGQIPLPCLTCNNIKNDFNAGHPFKLYTNSSSAECPAYSSAGADGPVKGCKDACDAQYQACINTYAMGCKDGKWEGGVTDTYQQALEKCHDQWVDCLVENKKVPGNDRCITFNSGWGN